MTQTRHCESVYDHRVIEEISVTTAELELLTTCVENLRIRTATKALDLDSINLRLRRNTMKRIVCTLITIALTMALGVSVSAQKVKPPQRYNFYPPVG